MLDNIRKNLVAMENVAMQAAAFSQTALERAATLSGIPEWLEDSSMVHQLSGNLSSRLEVAAAHRHTALAAEQMQEAIAASGIAGTLAGGSEFRQFLEDVKLRDEVLRASAEPLAGLRVTGAFDRISEEMSALRQANEAITEYEARFRNPAIAESARLCSEFFASDASQHLAECVAREAEVRGAMEKMLSPWLSAENPFVSVGAFAGLQGISSAIATMHPFKDALAETLRVDLGDWRDAITWPESVLADPIARRESYGDLGLNLTLTNFPAPAFEEVLDITELRDKPSELVDRYGEPIPPSDDEEEEFSLKRTNMAHDWLQRLERRLRKFIGDAMIQAFGSGWPKTRLPKDVYEYCQEKKREAEQNGESGQPLIAYANFTHYEKIICRKDNFRQVFKAHFGRPEIVRECLQRLYLPRNQTMHARLITLEDELLMYAEIKRLMKLIDGLR